MSQDSRRWSSVGVGWIDRSDRARVEVTGPERQVPAQSDHQRGERLAVSRGCEAFVTSPQGKTIGYVILHAIDDRILLRTDPGGMELAVPHLRKYGLFDDVAIDDRSDGTGEVHFLGAGVDELVRRAGGPVPEGGDYSPCRGRPGRPSGAASSASRRRGWPA